MGDPIFALSNEYVTASAALDPVGATYRGISGHDGAGTDYGPEGTAAPADLIRDTLRRLALVEGGDQLAASHLRERLEAQLAWHDTGEWKRDLAAAFGRLQGIRDSVDLVRRDGEDGWRRVAARLAAIPAMLAGWRDSLSLGLAEGLPAARRQALEGAVSADAYAEGTHDALVAAYGDGPLRDELVRAAAAHAAYARTADYLRRDYAEAGGRPLDEVEASLDATEFVDGADAYRAWLQDEHAAALWAR
jgi:hypothetical protein